MQFPAFNRIFVSATRAAITRLREIRRKNRAKVTLKDLFQHLLKDIGQASYGEWREFDRIRLGNSAGYFRSPTHS
ncbi:MAG: hypothetical protein ACREEK_28280 [Bradyrhizobium sp.]